MRTLQLAFVLLATPALALAQAPDPSLAAPVSQPAPTTPPPQATVTVTVKPSVLAKWTTTLYGFAELDVDSDSSESFSASDLPGNGKLARPGAYLAGHPRLTFSPRNSRLGLRFAGPATDDVKATALLETDFFGNQAIAASPGTSEGGFFTSPLLRIRHVYLKLETPVVDVTAGQTWSVFGMQPYFHPNTVLLQGVPGQVYSRTLQVRLAKTIKADAVSLDVAAAALRPPQRDSGVPDGQAGLRLSYAGLKGVRTAGGTGTGVDALAIGVSGVVRSFKVAQNVAAPTGTKSATGSGISVDAFVPVIGGSMEQRGNSLTLTGSFIKGSGIADLFTGLNGGLGSPITAAGNPAQNPDAGLVTYDAAGNLHAVEWQSWIAGLQYYLPGSGTVWVALNASGMKSGNIDDFGAAPTAVFNKSTWYEGALFWDATASTRFAVAYDRFDQTFADGIKAKNNRYQFSAWYIF